MCVKAPSWCVKRQTAMYVEMQHPKANVHLRQYIAAVGAQARGWRAARSTSLELAGKEERRFGRMLAECLLTAPAHKPGCAREDSTL